jgi:hypothetical protein
MTWLFENPIPLMVIGTVIGIVLLILVYQTGQPRWLYIFGGFVLFWGGLLVVEKLVVTPREKLLLTIEDGAAAVRANDWDRALTFVAPSAQKTAQKLQANARRYTIKEFSIVRRDLQFDNDSNPTKCDATLLMQIEESRLPYRGSRKSRCTLFGSKKKGNGWSRVTRSTIGNRPPL